MNKKILDFPEAAELANDDYIIFDSESGGGCRILGKTIAPVVYGIEATYTQTQEVTVDTPLDDLRQDLVVEAIYQHNRRKVVTDYTLSGTLSVGTSTVTVTYSGYTTTFNVEVTQTTNYIFNWDFKESVVDKVNNKTAILGNGATKTNNGIEMSLSSAYIRFMDAATVTQYSLIPTSQQNLILEIDVGNMNKQYSGNNRFIMWDEDEGFIFRGASSNWEIYQSGNWNSITWSDPSAKFDAAFFKDSTLKIVFTTGDLYIYKNDVLIGSSKNIYNNSKQMFRLVGSNDGYSYYFLTIEGIRIYFEEV